MFYPEEVIEDILSKNNILDVISDYVKVQKKGSSYFGLCPFHHEKSPSFSVSVSKQMYYCFGCGAGGNVITFVMEYEKFSFVEAVKYLAERSGVQLPEVEYSEERKKEHNEKLKLYEINKLAATYYYRQLKTPNGENARNYLVNRMLEEDTLKKFGLGYAGVYSNDLYQFLKSKGYQDDLLKESGLFTYDKKIGDKFWNRIMFPIMDINNRVIGFGGRVMGDAKPKYLNSPETKLFDKSRNLYGLNIARQSRKSNLIICEGYMDVISLHQAGFNQAVASLGTALTAGQAALMKRYTNEVLIAYDSDGAGVKAALRAIPILKEAGLLTKVINMKPYKDPDEFLKALGEEAYQKRIDEASNSFLFEISVLQRDYELEDPEEKTRFFQQIAKRLVEFSDEFERNNYIDAIAKEYQLPFESLKKMVANYGNRIGLVKKTVQPREDRVKKDKDDGMKKTQKIFFTMIINDKSLFYKISEVIKPEDFTDPLLKKVAIHLYRQFETGNVNPAAIVSIFESEEEHKEVAALFNDELSEELNDNERKKAMRDIVVRIKKNSLEYKKGSVKSAEEYMDLKREEKKLENINLDL